MLTYIVIGVWLVLSILLGWYTFDSYETQATKRVYVLVSITCATVLTWFGTFVASLIWHV